MQEANYKTIKLQLQAKRYARNKRVYSLNVTNEEKSQYHQV
jgi:hypothetical protein